MGRPRRCPPPRALRCSALQKRAPPSIHPAAVFSLSLSLFPSTLAGWVTHALGWDGEGKTVNTIQHSTNSPMLKGNPLYRHEALFFHTRRLPCWVFKIELACVRRRVCVSWAFPLNGGMSWAFVPWQSKGDQHESIMRVPLPCRRFEAARQTWPLSRIASPGGGWPSLYYYLVLFHH